MKKEIPEEYFVEMMQKMIANKTEAIKSLAEAISDEKTSIENFSIVGPIKENSELLLGNFYVYLNYLGNKEAGIEMKFELNEKGLPGFKLISPWEEEKRNFSPGKREQKREKYVC